MHAATVPTRREEKMLLDGVPSVCVHTVHSVFPRFIHPLSTRDSCTLSLHEDSYSRSLAFRPESGCWMHRISMCLGWLAAPQDGKGLSCRAEIRVQLRINYYCVGELRIPSSSPCPPEYVTLGPCVSQLLYSRETPVFCSNTLSKPIFGLETAPRDSSSPGKNRGCEEAGGGGGERGRERGGGFP